MNKQPIPEVTEKDVRKIALRDFGEAQLFTILSILKEFGKQDWNEPSPRVELAILKLASGDIQKLSKYTKAAIEDFRDVLAAAEYPRYSKEIGFDDVEEDYRESVIQDDWLQYCEWLNKE
jgi:hypothetical protein